MANLSPQEIYHRLISGSDDTRNSALERAVLAGQDFLSLGGIAAEVRPEAPVNVTATSYTAVPAYTLPDIPYFGRPIRFELSIPLVTASAAVTTVQPAFQIRSGAAVLATLGPQALATSTTTVCQMVALTPSYPLLGSFNLSPGDSIIAPTLFARVASGTATLNSEFNNGLLGNVLATFRAIYG